MNALATRVGVVAAGLLTGAPAFGAINGTLDDFQDQTMMGWSGEVSLMTVKPDGGPQGAGDAYLKITSIGGVGPGSRLATDSEETRWTGDYLAAGITGLEADFINFGSVPLEIRSVVFNGPGNRYTSTIAGQLPADGQWHHLLFSLDEASLTSVLGASTYNDIMSNVSAVMFRHNSGVPAFGGTAIVSSMGVDNIHAIPAPSAAALLGLFGAALKTRRGSRR